MGQRALRWGAGLLALAACSRAERAPAASEDAPLLLRLPGEPTLGGRCVPGLEVRRPFPFRTNSLGYRGPEPRLPKPKEAIRIAVVGGPFSFGRDAREERELLASQIRELLLRNVTDRAIEVLACGPGGSNEEAARGILEMDLGLDADPTLLVWILEPTEPAPRTPAGGALRLDSWDPAPAASQPGRATAARARALEELGRREAAALARGDRPAAVEPAVAARAVAVAQRCQGKKAAFLLAILPHPLDADSERRAVALASMPEAERAAACARAGFGEATVAAAAMRERGVAVLDLTVGLREAADLRRQDLWDVPSGRWNGAAAKLAAAQVAGHVIASGLAR